MASDIVKKTVSLPAQQAQYVDDLIKEGRFASASEVVRAGLRALEEQRLASERWIKEEILEVIEEFERDPSIGIPLEDVMAEIRTRSEILTKKSA